MSYSNKSIGNITIIKPNKCYSKVSNNIILDSRISHTSLRIALFLNLKHDNWFFTKEELMEALSVSKNVYSHSINELKEYGYLEVNKVSKGKGKGFSYQYSINTEGYTDPRKWDVETIRNPINDTYTDPRKWDVDKPSNNQDLNLKPSNSLISTTSQKVGSIYNTNLNNKTINNTKEKINNKKEGESMSYESTVKLMRDRLVYSGKVENLIKEFGIEEVNKHLKYLDYFDLDNKHENYKKNLTFAFLESLRNNLPAPQYYTNTINQQIHESRLEILEPILKLLQITSRDRIDLYLEICRNINYYRLQDKLTQDEYTKQGIDLANRRSLRSRQYELSLEEKSKLIEDLTLKFYKDKNTRIELAKKLVEYDIKKVLNLVKIILTDNKYSTISLKNELEEFKGDVNKYLFNLEIWVLKLSNKEVMKEVLI